MGVLALCSDRIDWESIFGTVDESLFTPEQIAELCYGKDLDLPVQLYADPTRTANEMKTIRCMLETAFSALRDPKTRVVCTEYGPEEVDGYFRSQSNFEKHPSWICYIPENWDFEEDGPGYTGEQIIRLCDNDPIKASMVFSICSWQHPETVLDEWDEYDEEVLQEMHRKKDHQRKSPALDTRIQNAAAGTSRQTTSPFIGPER